MKKSKTTKKVEKNFTIIIPSKILDKNLNNCIMKIKKFYPKIKIIVILDNLTNILYENVKFIKLKANIAVKRNFASKIAASKYLTFIDSDAFPENYWLNYVQDKFEKKKFDIIGGPNLSYCKNISQSLVARARFFKFVTLDTRVKDSNSEDQFIDFMPACNFSIKRSLYLKIGGMNENVDTGEEHKIFNYSKENNLKVYFLKKSYVQHIERDINKFFYQRMAYGKNILANVIESKRLSYLKYLISYLPTFYLLAFIVIFFDNSLFQIYFSGLFILSIIIVFYAVKISIKYFFKSLIVIIAAIFGPGLGFLYSLLGFSTPRLYNQTRIINDKNQ